MTRSLVRWLIAAALTLTALVCSTVLWIHGPPDAQQWVGTAAAGVLSLAGAFGPLLVAYLGRDTDGDGKPDVIDRTPHGSVPPLAREGTTVQHVDEPPRTKARPPRRKRR